MLNLYLKDSTINLPDTGIYPVCLLFSIFISRFLFIHLRFQKIRRGARVVEEARLESVYTPKGYREFESLPLRKICQHQIKTQGIENAVQLFSIP